jgi:peptide/nickel transport system ATP-binding protein
MSAVCLSLHGISKVFSGGWGKSGSLSLFRDVSFEINPGETLGIMGHSGAGKTTLGKIISGLEKPSSGYVAFKGKNISQLKRKEFQQFRRGIQMIFQDPEGSFNPVKTLGQSLHDVLKLVRCPLKRREAVIKGILQEVGLYPDVLLRLPSQLSGGMNQRAALARVLLLEPDLIVLDEPTSALDLTVQAQILHLLKRLKNDKRLSYVLISHNSQVIDFMCDRVGILDNGRFFFLKEEI